MILSHFHSQSINFTVKPRAATLRRAIAGAAMATATLTAAPAILAQGQEVIGLEEIVVTARRRAESLQDVPIAITAVDEEFLRTQNIASLEDLGTHVPAFRVTQGASTNATIISLRGQRPVEVLLTLDPAVPLYFGDVVLTPTYGTNLAMYDLENVQVLKGPQGTLFGRNSTGGAVLATPKRPGDEFGGYAEVKLGDYDLVHLEGAVDMPVSDALKFRLAGRKVERDGYQDNVADNALACSECYWDEDSYGVRASMEITPSDEFRNLTMLSYDENDMAPRMNSLRAFNRVGGLPSLYNLIHNGALGQMLNPTLGFLNLPLLPDQPLIDASVARQNARGSDGRKIETDMDGREVVENTLFINTTEFDISDRLTVRNILGYRKLDYFAAMDADGSALPLFGAITSTTSNVTYDPPGQNTDSEQWSEEFQLLGTAFDDKLDWIVGAFWMKMEGSTYYESTVIGANPDWPAIPPSAIAPIFGPELAGVWATAQMGIPQLSEDTDVTNEARAIFGEATYTLNDQWAFTLGLRQTWDDREMTTRKRELDGRCGLRGEDGQMLPDDACSRTVEEDFSSPTWRLSASYTPDADHMFFGSISTGYRAGGFNARGVENESLKPFDEETALNYEVGYKGDWQLGNTAIRANVALFFQEYDDIQKTQDTSFGTEYVTTIVNAAEAEIKGGEIELTIAPSGNLEFGLSYSLVDASYKDWVLPTLVGLDGQGNPIIDIYDNSNADFTYIPKHSMTGQARYTLPLDPELGEVSLMASVYWQDKMTTNEEFSRWPTLGWLESDLANGLKWTELDSYTVWNVRVDWRNVMGSSFDLALYSNNVLDEEYFSVGQTVLEQLGQTAVTTGAPRTIGAALRYNF